MPLKRPHAKIRRKPLFHGRPFCNSLHSGIVHFFFRKLQYAKKRPKKSRNFLQIHDSYFSMAHDLDIFLYTAYNATIRSGEASRRKNRKEDPKANTRQCREASNTAKPPRMTGLRSRPGQNEPMVPKHHAACRQKEMGVLL